MTYALMGRAGHVVDVMMYIPHICMVCDYAVCAD